MPVQQRDPLYEPLNVPGVSYPPPSTPFHVIGYPLPQQSYLVNIKAE